jgi:tetratricopeptide (TPR) repeat protein
MTQHPLCFVLMPFGQKRDPGTGKMIDFDRVYEEAIRPAVLAAEMDPIRADEERVGGIIHKPMFERLMLCDYAIADLTTANANVFYELGVRHAVRPSTTLAIFASGQPLPFDANFMRALPYSLGESLAFASGDAARLQRDLTNRLLELKRLQQQAAATDSPIFQLLPDYRAPDIARLKTDVFRAKAEYAANVKNDLAKARSCRDREGIHAIEKGLGLIADAEAGVVVDTFLSYRAVSDWNAMVDLFGRMPVTLQRSIMVREQLGFAYNRLGQRDEATRVLEDVLKEQGPSSETCGLLGRIQKDLWVEATKAKQPLLARGHLDRAIDMYRLGFETDPRDPDAIAERNRLVPVVLYAVQRRLKSTRPDYWDYATLLELAVLAEDQKDGVTSLARALAAVREPWEPQTTANNLGFIRDARAARGADVGWVEEIIAALKNAKGLGA